MESGGEILHHHLKVRTVCDLWRNRQQNASGVSENGVHPVFTDEKHYSSIQQWIQGGFIGSGPFFCFSIFGEVWYAYREKRKTPSGKQVEGVSALSIARNSNSHCSTTAQEGGDMGKVKLITEKLSAQEKIVRAIRIFEKRKNRLKLLIDTLRAKNAGPRKE